MIKIQKIGKNLALLLIAAGLFACSDDENVEEFKVLGDVFVTKRLADNQVMFAKSYFVYGTQPMETAKVTTPDAEEILLTATDSRENTFSKVATSSDYTANIPTEGNYQFNVVFQGTPQQSVDLLQFDNLDLPVITIAELANFVLSVEWDANVGTDNYMLSLRNESDEIIYNTTFLPSHLERFDINPSSDETGTWATNYPNIGDIYTLELHAIKFDPDAASNDYNVNIQLQEVAIGTHNITWE